MDSIALVEEQIKAGQKLVERLNREKIPVVAAAWIKQSEGSQWYLFLVTPLVGEDRATKLAYHRITPVIRQVHGEGFEIDPFEVKVVGPAALREKRLRRSNGSIQAGCEPASEALPWEG